MRTGFLILVSCFLEKKKKAFYGNTTPIAFNEGWRERESGVSDRVEGKEMDGILITSERSMFYRNNRHVFPFPVISEGRKIVEQDLKPCIRSVLHFNNSLLNDVSLSLSLSYGFSFNFNLVILRRKDKRDVWNVEWRKLFRATTIWILLCVKRELDNQIYFLNLARCLLFFFFR